MKTKRYAVKRRFEGRQIFGYGRTKEAALADVEAKLEELSTLSTARAQIPTSLHECAKAYWFPRIALIKPQSRERYVGAYVNHIRPALGHMEAKNITPEDVQNFVAHLTSKLIHPNGRANSKPRPMDPTGVRYVASVLKQITKLLSDLDVIGKDPCRLMKVPKAKAKREKFVTVEEAQVILQNVPKELYLPTFLAMVLGLRRGEVCGLRWDDLDRQTGTLRIRRQVGRTLENGRGVAVMPLKADSSRDLMPGRKFIDVIDAHGDLDSEWVCTIGGERWSPDNLTHAWTRWENRPDDLRFHDLRHLAAGLLYAATKDALAVQVILGHSSIDMTSVYLAKAAAQSSKPFQGLEAIIP